MEFTPALYLDANYYFATRKINSDFVTESGIAICREKTLLTFVRIKDGSLIKSGYRAHRIH